MFPRTTAGSANFDRLAGPQSFAWSASLPSTMGAGRTPEALRRLVEHSAAVSTLDERYRGHLASALKNSRR